MKLRFKTLRVSSASPCIGIGESAGFTSYGVIFRVTKRGVQVAGLGRYGYVTPDSVMVAMGDEVGVFLADDPLTCSGVVANVTTGRCLAPDGTWAADLSLVDGVPRITIGVDSAREYELELPMGTTRVGHSSRGWAFISEGGNDIVVGSFDGSVNWTASLDDKLTSEKWQPVGEPVLHMNVAFFRRSASGLGVASFFRFDSGERIRDFLFEDRYVSCLSDEWFLMFSDDVLTGVNCRTCSVVEFAVPRGGVDCRSIECIDGFALIFFSNRIASVSLVDGHVRSVDIDNQFSVAYNCLERIGEVGVMAGVIRPVRGYFRDRILVSSGFVEDGDLECSEIDEEPEPLWSRETVPMEQGGYGVRVSLKSERFDDAIRHIAYVVETLLPVLSGNDDLGIVGEVGFCDLVIVSCDWPNKTKKQVDVLAEMLSRIVTYYSEVSSVDASFLKTVRVVIEGHEAS